MYKTNTKLPPERQTVIKNAVTSSTEEYIFREYQNKPIKLPVVRLDITALIYHVNNYRTQTAQLEHIHDHKLPPDFFKNGQENESVQQAQHDILTIFAKQGSTSVSPIFDELKTEEQREPLLITDHGVVVNGNRRLAAIRELFVERSKEFKHFSHVDCAVLPANVTPKEIHEIEMRLQMQPETKLPYGWINESIAIRDMMDRGRNADYIAGLMKKNKRDVERMVRALREVNIYLEERLRKPGEYQRVEKAEQFFNELAKALKDAEGDILEAKRRIAWALVSNPEKVKGRIYSYAFSFDKKTGEVINALSDRLSIDLSPKVADNADDLDVDLGGDDKEISLDSFVEAFDDPERRVATENELVEVCNSIKEQEDYGVVGQKALRAIQNANRQLMSVDLSKADATTYGAIEAQLESVRSQVEKLKKELVPYRSGGSSSRE